VKVPTALLIKIISNKISGREQDKNRVKNYLSTIKDFDGIV